MPLSELCFNGYHDACHEAKNDNTDFNIIKLELRKKEVKESKVCNCPCHKGVKVK